MRRAAAALARRAAATARGSPARAPTAARALATAAPPAADAAELAKFRSYDWWDPSGPAAPLHALNPARVGFVREEVLRSAAVRGVAPPSPDEPPLARLRLLDVGCGGGILAEALARLGAAVTGIDAGEEGPAAGAAHAAHDPPLAARLDYRAGIAEAEAASHPGQYDAVVASEVIEHVPDPAAFVAALARAAAPGGAVILSTLARTPRSWAVAIAGAEYVARLLPPGTHDWGRFINPEELAALGDGAGLDLARLAGMAPVGQRARWVLTDDPSVNYIAAFVKRDEG
jgi:ubiquinone biosynthesis O-methyltransferase